MSLYRSVPELVWQPEPAGTGAPPPAKHPLAAMAGVMDLVLDAELAERHSVAAWREAARAWKQIEEGAQGGRRPSMAGRGFNVIGLANFVKLSFLTRLMELSGAVARLWVSNRDEGTDKPYYGTGFLVGPRLILTNSHVVQYPADADATVVRFDYDEAGPPDRFCEYRCAELVTSDPDLDYAVLRLEPEPTSVAGDYSDEELDLEQRPLISVRDHGARPIPNQDSVVLIQHPDGRPKEVVYEDAIVRSTRYPYIQYEADTEGGSSGSPVLDAALRLVALHHHGAARYNQGVDIGAVADALAATLPEVA